MSRAFVSPYRLGAMTCVIVMSFAVVFGRLVDLHVLQRPKLLDEAHREREKFDVLYSRRGDIVDQHDSPLATSRTVIEVGVDPSVVELTDKDKAKWPALAQLLGVPVADIAKAFTTQFSEVDSAEDTEHPAIRWTVLNPGLEPSLYEQVQALKIKGVYGNLKYQRIYPDGQIAAHVLGYMNKDGPQAGIESAMNFYLSGQDGWRETEQDGHHHELDQYSREVKPADGLNVELTIDLRLQDYAEQEVDRLVKEYQPLGVTIIMSEPSSGEILALANYPTYDPNHYSDVPLVNLKNRALSDVYEPGSTFKIVTAAAALNEGVVRPTDTFDCSKPTIEVNGRTLTLPHDAEQMGILTVDQIVAQSSNRGAANIGVKLGPARLHDYAAAFGFGQTTGLGLAGESRGVLHPTRDFDTDSLLITRVPMGQGVDATALQVHMAMSVIANHGVLMEPHIVRRITDPKITDPKLATVVEFDPKAVRRVISTDTADLLNTMLCEVVKEGTATRASLGDITVAGKTGTAQKIIDGQYSHEHFVATFSGYLPAELPRLVITVIVDDAKMKGNATAYGGLVSAAAFKQLAQDSVNYLGIQPYTQPVGGRNNLVAMKGDNLDWFR
jgi:cell division protein FtsI (penicillin-binding protein 3)/stage V sporulation protein D (sporulation-specific penicillin-binding protein)